MAKMNKVCVNLDQSNPSNGGFTDAEKAQARTNIGASDGKVPWVEYSEGQPTPTVTYSEITVVQSDIGPRIQNADASKQYMLAPKPSQADAGKVLGLNSVGGVAWINAPTGVPASSASDAGKVLTVDNSGNPVWQTPAGVSTDVGVYEFTVTKVLDGTGTALWSGSGLTSADISESFVNCTSATCPVHILLDDYGRLVTSLAAGYDSITCESHTYVSDNANFATELGMWGYDNLCQVVAGMNRTWYLTHGSNLDQNGIRSTTETLKSGTLTIKFDFVFRV